MSQVAVARGTRRTPAVREQLVAPRQLVHSACGLAWVGLLLYALTSATDDRPQHHSGSASWWHWPVMWTVMVVAMMWPLTTSGLELALRRTYRRWRFGVAAIYLTTYTALWLSAGLVALGVQMAVSSFVSPWAWAAGWLVVAIVVLRSPRRMQLLWSCHRRSVQPAAGTAALAASARSARKLWRRCALLCGPAMMAMVPMAAGMWTVMAAGAGAVWWEQRHPRAWRDPVPFGLLSVALVATLVGAP